MALQKVLALSITEFEAQVFKTLHASAQETAAHLLQCIQKRNHGYSSGYCGLNCNVDCVWQGWLLGN